MVLALAAAVWPGVGSTVARAQPSLTHVTPAALAPGKTTEVTLHGAKLGGALRVWTSFPAQVELAVGDDRQSDKNQVVCKLTLSTGVAVGIGGIAVASADGLSDVVYLMIDDLPSIADAGNNHSPAQPQDVSIPVGMDGQC